MYEYSYVQLCTYPAVKKEIVVLKVVMGKTEYRKVSVTHSRQATVKNCTR